MENENRGEIKDPVSVPEILQKTHGAVYIATESLKNIILTFIHAAEWEEDNPDADWTSWSLNIAIILNHFMNSLQVNTIELTEAAHQLVPKSAGPMLAGECESLLDEVSKLHDLLLMFEIVSGDEEEGGLQNPPLLEHHFRF